MLPNLNELVTPIVDSINKFNVLDCTLPVAFKQNVTSIKNCPIEYGITNSCITNKAGQHIFLSNSWFYIAAIISPLYQPFNEYKNLLNSIVDKDVLKDSNVEKTKIAIESSTLDDQDKLYLFKFATDQKWWNGGNSNTGGKTLDRNDALVSAILSIANLVNNSQSYVATLWEYLGEHPDFAKLLNDNLEQIEKKSILPQNNALDEIADIMKNFIEALRTKPFLLLAGISGTGKSQKVKELAFMTCPKDELGSTETTPGNYCLVEVKPNWHDSSELLGYYSNLTKKYQVTDFLRFVYKATKNPGYPFFICLDEMNLAPVEQYFAEYLSVLETRTLVGGEVTTAELLSKDSFKGYDSDAGYTDEDREVVEFIQSNGLRLPENLFVVGTVNMDDTTHQFSRKVIDRAFTIEMNGGKLDDMFSDENRNSLSYRDTPVSLDVFKPKYVKAAEALEDSAIIPYADAIKKEVPEALDKINDILKDTPFRVSYRVQNELILYAVNIMLASKGENPDINSIIKEAALVILLEKILPRVQGDDKLLGAGDDSVFKKLQGLLSADYSNVNGSDVYQEVDSKLKEMDTRLTNSYFANFF